jgi:hypothetical protein
MCIKCERSRDSSVGIATRCGLDGPGIESWWGARFSAPVQTGSEAHPASCTMGTGSFAGVKQQVRGTDHPPPSSAEVKERVELYLCSPSSPSWLVLGWTLPYKMWEVKNCLELVKSCAYKICALNYDLDCWMTIFSEFLFSPPWGWPHEWLKRVGDHCTIKLHS